MLAKIIIKNFALIEKEEIEFDKKLNVLSGETGAGKSIIFGALNFVLGERADKTFIRKDQTSMRVEAVFDNISSEVDAILDELGIDKEEDSVYLSRIMNSEGKTEARVNGTLVTASSLKRITSFLIDVYGQHEHQTLLKQGSHLEILDNYSGEELLPLKQKYKDKLTQLKQINDILSKNYGDEESKKHKLELLEYEINEITTACLVEGEEEELLSQKKIIQNSEKIAKELENIKSILYSGYNGGDITSALKETEYSLKGLKNIDECFADFAEKMESLRFELMSLEGEIEEKCSLCEYDENELNSIEERLDLIKSLKRKYGTTIDEINSYLISAKQEYDNIVHNDEIVAKLTKEKETLLDELFVLVNKITNVRKKYAKRLENSILGELKDLGMKGANFVVAFSEDANRSEVEKRLLNSGVDEVEFMFTANVGQPLKQLSKVISGGEMSRFMLAYKKVVSEKDNIDCLLFDEIDNGISGTIGQEVANKLAHISRKCQVISISHLSQIVCMADKNFLIEKKVVCGETLSNISPIDGEQLNKEIARLNGASISELSLLHAKELKENADSYKLSINE